MKKHTHTHKNKRKKNLDTLKDDNEGDLKKKWMIKDISKIEKKNPKLFINKIKKIK